jgi:bifunctional DNA-binding transcriptional regulator/antitoxin component of YhaV-PrlF toxin-antitoxin module
MAMSLVEVDSRYRVTLTSNVRKSVEIRKGQRVYVVPKGDSFIVIPLTGEVDSEIQELIGDVKFSRAAKRRAESFLLKQAK